MEIDQFRREYLSAGLRRKDLREDPVEQFELWLSQVIAGGITDPTAMVLATVDTLHRPWQRIVLLKDFSRQGFVFYTNRKSHKARDIAGNTQVSLLFPWNVLERQVIVGGPAERISAAEEADYFHTRPRESQLSSWASNQSRPLESRALLEQRMQEMGLRFQGGEVPVAPDWCGFRVLPERFEFWQGAGHRLHDRFQYRRGEESGWLIQRLQP